MPYDSETQKTLDIAYHREAAAKYDAVVTNHFHYFHVHSLHPWTRRLLAAQPDAEVLDIGTGTGVVACTLAQLGCRHVRGIDHSPEMLATAQARVEFCGVADRVQFDRGDGERLPYDDESFDAVTIQGVLHHLPDTTPIIMEAIRVLRPGGQLYISEPCQESTAISRVVNALTRTAARALCWMRREPPAVSEHELPIAGPELVASLQKLGMRVEVEYLVHVGAVRFLPQSWRIRATLAFSWPTRRSHGDLIFLVAHKNRSPHA